MWVIVMRIGTDGAREHLSYVLPRFVDGGEDNMAGWLAIELLDSFTQIRFDDLDATILQEWPSAIGTKMARLVADLEKSVCAGFGGETDAS